MYYVLVTKLSHLSQDYSVYSYDLICKVGIGIETLTTNFEVDCLSQLHFHLLHDVSNGVSKPNHPID